jgi:hypothetical protein
MHLSDIRVREIIVERTFKRGLQNDFAMGIERLGRSIAKDKTLFSVDLSDVPVQPHGYTADPVAGSRQITSS